MEEQPRGEGLKRQALKCDWMSSFENRLTSRGARKLYSPSKNRDSRRVSGTGNSRRAFICFGFAHLLSPDDFSSAYAAKLCLLKRKSDLVVPGAFHSFHLP